MCMMFGCCGPPPFATIKAYNNTTPFALDSYDDRDGGAGGIRETAVIDWNVDGVPDLALPDAARRRMRIVTLAGGVFTDLAEIPHDTHIATAVIATDLDADGAPELLYGLDDGTVVLARP